MVKNKYYIYLKEENDKYSRPCELLDVQYDKDEYRISLFDDKKEKKRDFHINNKFPNKIVYADAEANKNDLNKLYEIFDKYIKDNNQTSLRDKGNKLLIFLKKQYNFEGFFHETHINNLAGILKSGYLKSRKYLEDNDELFIDSADKDVLKTNGSKTVKDRTRFYFYYGTPTNYRFNEKYPGQQVYIVFDWNILYDYCENVTISDGNSANSASKSLNINEFLDQYDTFMDWKSIFHRGVIRDDINKEELKRKRNAEVDFNCFISTDYIFKIIFASIDSKQQFVKLLNDSNLLKKYEGKMYVIPMYFQ